MTTDAGASAEGITGADILGRALAEAGCTHAFGIPGGEVLALIEGLDKAGIRFVLTKHENAAGFMAEGVWHAQSHGAPSGSAAPGLLVATLGPGVANAINVVANAYQDRVPLLFLTGRVPAATAESYTHQVFDHRDLLRPIVKGSFEARPGTVGLVVQKALALSLDGQPGPVHLDLPIDVMEGAARDGDEVRPVAPTAPAAMALAETDPALAAFARATRPLVIAGVDAVNEGAGPALADFCRRHAIPLVTSYKAKGLLDETHPLCLGAAGLSPKADAILLPLIGKADAILLAGYDPIEMRVGWRRPWSAETAAIDITPVLRDHGMHDVSLTLRSAVAPALEAIDPGMARGHRWPDDEIGAARTALAEAFATEAEGFGPAAVFHTLDAALPDDTIATADSGAHRILASHVWRARGPRGMLQSSALCTMGCAVPLAAGHRLVDQRPVIAFVGDAGLEMGLGELATLRDLALPVIVCVLVDESLALIEKKQRSSQRPNLGVDFDGSDFPAVAAALGGHGVWIADAETLKTEAYAALERDTFTVLACRIGRRAYDGKI